MINDIFQVDWVFVDTMIIILLFLLLIGIKVFKATHRWRTTISNNNLSLHSFSKTPKNLEHHFIKTTQWIIAQNSLTIEQNKKSPLILILRTNLKRRLNKILTEGLCSYGFTVIHAKIKIEHNHFPETENNIIENEFKYFISSILDYFEKEGLISNSDHLTINYAKSLLPPTAILSEPDNIGLILINPKINKKNVGHFKELLISSLQFPQLFYIFSERNALFLKNRSLSCIIKEINDKNKHKVQLKTLEKSNRSFKYYETILLGIIIDIIETKLMKSKHNK
ncbi:MAG: hypothetical protein ACXAEX_03100 [Promethearchaeota archaeon]|jgi:hypothetical protein